MDKDKRRIIKLFNSNVRGKRPNTDEANKKHAGKEGHWLEVQMNIAHNADNAPDIYGYEMKNATGSKTTFGDWSADSYIWKNSKFNITRDDFLQIFGKPNEKKGGRFSWSGEPCPTIHGFNKFGQRLYIDKMNNIVVEYSYTNDARTNKKTLIPKIMQLDSLELARWDAESIRKKVEQKFNLKGWFKCQKNVDGIYSEIVFGNPITFDQWLEGVRKGLIFFDSGMYQTNKRNYSQWRGNNSYWDSLVVERY